MNPPKMPIHIGDYKRDTGHLRAAGHGAYLLLMFHYWATGSLPDDDEQLAAIACMTPAEWKRHKPILAKFFKEGWAHGRINDDLAKAKASYEKRAEAGQRGGKAKASNKQSPSNAKAGPELPYTFNQYTEPNGSGDTSPRVEQKKELFLRGKSVLGAKSGGVIIELLRSFGPEDDAMSIAKARARIEEASTKANPMEWLKKTMLPKRGEFKLMSGMEGVV